MSNTTSSPRPQSTFHGRHERPTQLFPHPDYYYVGKHERHYHDIEVTGELSVSDKPTPGKVVGLPPEDQDFIMAQFYATQVGKHLKALSQGARLG